MPQTFWCTPIHIQQRLEDDGNLLLKASYTLSGDDQNFAIRLGKPFFSIGRDHFVYGIFKTGKNSVS